MEPIDKLKELGAYLRQQREDKKISLEEVSVATKISIKLLQALEEGDVHKLPAKTFVRGFIQSYARYLGLDVQEVLSRFQETAGSTNPELPAINLPQTENIEKNLPGSGRNIITVALIVITIIGIIIIQRILAQRESEMKSSVQAITGNDTPLKLSPTPGASVNPSASPGASPTASGSPAASAAASASASPSPSPTPSPSASPSPTPSPAASLSPSPTPPPEPSPTPAPKPSAVPEAAAPQEVIIEALDHVTIRVTIDNKPPQEVSMNPDQIQTFRAKTKIKIYTPNGGAISVIQNGYDYGVPGNLGQPKLMVFPR